MPVNIVLPPGWVCDGTYGSDECLTYKHDRCGYITVDYHSRSFAMGIMFPRRGPHTSCAKGRGWKQQLINEAIAKAMSIWE